MEDTRGQFRPEVESQPSRVESQKKPAAIFKAMADVMREVGAVACDKMNKEKRYGYRSAEAVYNRIQPLMAKFGIVGVPEVIRDETVERKVKSGATAYITKLTVRYTFFGEDGSSVVAVVVAEGADFGDSTSAAKAMTIAHRFALCQVFNIPFATIDPEANGGKEFNGRISASELNDIKRAWHTANKDENEQLSQEARQMAFRLWVKQTTEVDFNPLDHRQWTTELWIRCRDALKPKTETTA